MIRNATLKSLQSRRGLLRRGAIAGAGLVGNRWVSPRPANAGAYLSVLCPTPPDPAPPGVAYYSLTALDTWQKGFQSRVYYEAAAWSQIHAKLRNNFASDDYNHDVIYMCGWIPEFSRFLAPIDDLVPPLLGADLPASAFRAGMWGGDRYGVPFTLSLLTLYSNTGQLAAAGISKPPATWADLVETAKELTRGDQFGWVSNYGTPNGISGTASYWMAFLQQAGGMMYGVDGLPAFNNASGVDALQVMIDLMPYSHPSSFANTGIVDATAVFVGGQASMMMNWPFMWAEMQNVEISQVAETVTTTILPAGPAGSASIDGADTWTIPSKSKVPDLAMSLIDFYLDVEVQKQQAIETGWLPIRLSALKDPEVGKKMPIAPVLLQQSTFPYDSFITPDYDAVTTALGTEILLALRGRKSAAEAIADAADAVTAIVKQRPATAPSQ